MAATTISQFASPPRLTFAPLPEAAVHYRPRRSAHTKTHDYKAWLQQITTLGKFDHDATWKKWLHTTVDEYSEKLRAAASWDPALHAAVMSENLHHALCLAKRMDGGPRDAATDLIRTQAKAFTMATASLHCQLIADIVVAPLGHDLVSDQSFKNVGRTFADHIRGPACNVERAFELARDDNLSCSSDPSTIEILRKAQLLSDGQPADDIVAAAILCRDEFVSRKRSIRQLEKAIVRMKEALAPIIKADNKATREAGWNYSSFTVHRFGLDPQECITFIAEQMLNAFAMIDNIVPGAGVGKTPTKTGVTTTAEFLRGAFGVDRRANSFDGLDDVDKHRNNCKGAFNRMKQKLSDANRQRFESPLMIDVRSWFSRVA